MANISIRGIDVEGVLRVLLEQLGSLPEPSRTGRRTAQRRRQASGTRSVVIARTAYDAAMAHLRWRGREQGGMLIGPRDHHWVSHFVPDLTGTGTASRFELGVEVLNETLRKYLPLGLDAKGLIHAHPPGNPQLSDGDLSYVGKLLGAPRNRRSNERLLMPIVCDGAMLPYIIDPRDPSTVHEGRLIIQ